MRPLGEERMTVRVKKGLRQQLEAEARAKGVSPSEVVRQAIEEHLRQQHPAETCYDLAKRLGIIGVYTDTPTDLSTNPAHMEGFGE
jgi:metal-responsive CopG/Arc/MetJ family transcriptional regulator